MKRRDLLKLSAASLSYLSLPTQSYAKKPSVESSDGSKKMVWILLRGAMDGLHATIPLFDQNLMALRRDLVIPIQDQARPLTRGFALHPELQFAHKLFAKGQLNSVVATATPYRKRSHFVGQDILESGFKQADVDSGWLARTLAAINTEETNIQGLAVARSLPISMRGDNKQSMTWYPSNFSASSDDLHNQLLQLYQYDDKLSNRLEQALEIQALVGGMNKSKQRGKFSELAKSCATLLKEPSGPSIAMLEMNGWDTHKQQVNNLNRSFKTLDDGIKSLHDELGDQWQNTVVIVASEFGRTVKINGTKGTDHGTGTSMFIAGGGIKGGRVLGQWPGLSEGSLYQGRDLRPTSDTFSWIAAAVAQHWQLDKSQIESIFPDTSPLYTKLI